MTALQNTIGSFPLVASALGRKYGVEVRIGGDDAYTNGAVIQLPSLPADADMLDMLRGYLDHEAAHIRFSDFGVIGESACPAEKLVFNILEDYRVERRIGEYYPGCANNLRILAAKLFLPSGRAGPCPPETQVLQWVQYYVRTWMLDLLSAERDRLRASVDSAYPGLCAVLAPILDEARDSAASCSDMLGYARKICAVLGQTQCHPASTAQETQGQERGDDTHDQGKSASQPGKSRCGTGSPRSVPQGMPPGECGEDSGGEAEHQGRTLLERLNESPEDLPSTTGEKVRTILSEKHGGKQGSRSPVIQVAEEEAGDLDACAVFSAEEMREARLATAVLRRRLQGLFLAQSMSRMASARRGRIEPRRLALSSVGEDRLFCRESGGLSTNAAIHILLDASGSMTGTIDTAALSCYAIADALQMPRLDVAVTVFPGTWRDDIPTVTPMVCHGKRFWPWRKIQVSGMTPLAPAMWYAMQKLSHVRMPRKILLVITDGMPDSAEDAAFAVQAAEACGVEVYGLGIIFDEVKTFMPRSVVINSVSDLPRELFGLFRRALIRAA